METQNMVLGIPKVFPPKIICNLELVHSDVCCINLPSLVGARYILNCIDDISCFTWVYFVKNTNIIFEKFREFRAISKK
jgi:hypothetical protein